MQKRGIRPDRGGGRPAFERGQAGAPAGRLAAAIPMDRLLRELMPERRGERRPHRRREAPKGRKTTGRRACDTDGSPAGKKNGGTEAA